ncbi:AGAMOUS-like 29 [Euphorbia peplus]|nr:AGAMOUS-like 29 [Euphorbia peplus]
MVHKKSQSNRPEGANAREISLSKRRTGVYRKGSAIDTTYVVLSQGGPNLSFGSPCCEEAMKNLGDSPDSFAKHMAEHEATISKLTKEYEDMLQELAFEKKRGEELDRLPKGTVHQLLERPIEELNMNELMSLKVFMEETKAQLLEVAKKRGFELSITPDFGSANAGSITFRRDGNTAELNGNVTNGI